MTKLIDTIEQIDPFLETAGGVYAPASGTVFDRDPAMEAAPAGNLPSLGSPASGGAMALSTITGTNGADLIVGTSAGDVIDGLAGADRLYGLDGNDTIHGGQGDDVINGGTGSDILRGDGGDDYLFGDEGNDLLYGDDGNDIIEDVGGNDSLFGGAGDDIMRGGDGADAFDGGANFDTVSYNSSPAVSIDLTQSSGTWTGAAKGDSFTSIEAFSLSGSDDIFVGAGGADFVDGGAGDDQLYGGEGDDSLHGGPTSHRHGVTRDGGDDFLFGGGGDDTLDAGGGNDSLNGGAGADILSGGEGYDSAGYDGLAAVTIDLAKASSTWSGDAQGDVLTSIEEFFLSRFADNFRGDANANIVDGAGGDDQIFGAGGDDTLRGGSGNDSLSGGEGNDILQEGGFSSGDDFLQGNAGDDQLYGGRGNDKLVGGVGNDIVSGGVGGDSLIGNEGADIFRYMTVEESQLAIINGFGQQDQISYFTQGQDKIDLSAIDANPLFAGNEAFLFVSDPTQPIDDWSSLVWAITDARGITTIYASTDEDADPEMQIYMSHAYTFTANDFIL